MHQMLQAMKHFNSKIEMKIFMRKGETRFWQYLIIVLVFPIAISWVVNSNDNPIVKPENKEIKERIESINEILDAVQKYKSEVKEFIEVIDKENILLQKKYRFI